MQPGPITMWGEEKVGLQAATRIGARLAFGRDVATVTGVAGAAARQPAVRRAIELRAAQWRDSSTFCCIRRDGSLAF